MERTSMPTRAPYAAPKGAKSQRSRPMPSTGSMYREPFEPAQPTSRGRNPYQAQAKAQRGGGGMRTSSRIAMYVFVVVTLMLLFLQITRLAQISQQSKQISSLRTNIRTSTSSISNKTVRYNMLHDINRIRAEAMYELGMIQPEEGQIRVVAMQIPSVDTQMQTAHSGTQMVE